MVTTVGRPEHLQSTCDLILQVPLMTLEQVKNQLCLIADLLLETRVKKRGHSVHGCLFLYGTRPILSGRTAL